MRKLALLAVQIGLLSAAFAYGSERSRRARDLEIYHDADGQTRVRLDGRPMHRATMAVVFGDHKPGRWPDVDRVRVWWEEPHR